MRNGFFSSALTAAVVMAGCALAPAQAFQPVGSYLTMKQTPVMTIQPAAFPTTLPIQRNEDRHDRATVAMPGTYEAGAILVVNSQRKLYLSLGDGRALVYPIAIGKPGMSWTGETRVTGKAKNPTWTPTANTRRLKPGLPAFVAAGPKNPLGPRAVYLAKGYYRIHGTNQPSSIGSAASLGCFRMYNSDVVDLFSRVETGARVVVIN
ncbi:MAG TPA: L,D-transpeptidase [Beijerinckiaceae bacterium]|nr:L,D-transpeptidase [Beijerinckiaceae bacterium]